jgi:single-strand DNA-binding protein
MQNYDIVTIEGRATQDPTLKKTKTGKSVCGFSLAVNHYSKDESEPKVSFIDVEAWDKLAEICSGNVTKGRRLMVVGSLRQDRWEGQDGKKQSRIKIVGKEVRFLETLKKQEGEPARKSA